MVLYDVEWYIRSVVAWVEARGKHVESDQTNLVYTMNYDCQAVFILIFFSVIGHPLSVCIMLYINLSLSCIMFCMVSCSYEYPFLLLWTDIFILYIAFN